MENIDKNIFSTLVIEGETYKTLLTQKFIHRKKWEGINKKLIISFIPGTIIKVSVVPGQKVSMGEEMIIIDAMKMRSHMNVPFDGVIKTIFVAEGQQIPKGYTILEFE
jgi:acetyl/propionyl-CoA carboxylase alpha subunit